MTADDLKLLGGGGFAAALLYLLYLVGSRMVAALDRVAIKIDAHTAADLASHAELREAIVRVDAKMDGAADQRERAYTPIEGVPVMGPRERARSHPLGVPTTYSEQPGKARGR